MVRPLSNRAKQREEKLQRGLPLVFPTHLTLERLEIIGQYGRERAVFCFCIKSK